MMGCGKRASLMATAFITHADCARHDMGRTHPESPARLAAIEDHLVSSGLAGLIERHEAPAAKVSELARVHPLQYIEAIRQASPRSGIVHLDPDTAMCPYTWDAALHAAGAAVLATDLVIGARAENAFCAVRPPGHHATRTRAMGFCLFNNVAVGAKHALEQHGVERVAIVDFDVHHGNGTEDIFSDDEHVEDYMAGLRFTEADYAWVTQRIKEVADKYAGGRIVSVLEGGYALSALGRSVVTHLKILAAF